MKLDKYKIRISAREQIEPEEIFFDTSKIKEFEEEDIEAGKFETPISPAVFRFFSAIQIAALFAIGAFTAYMVIVHGSAYVLQAHANTVRTSPIFAPRGIIFSSDGEALAQNEIYFDVLFNPAHLASASEEYLSELARSISDLLEFDRTILSKKIQEAAAKRFSEYVLLKGISKDDLSKVESIVANNPLFEIRQVYRRKYADIEIFSHIVGYTGEVTSLELGGDGYFPGERVGKSGIEAFYDSKLRGKSGIFIRQVNSLGTVFEQNVQREAQPGENIKITLNAELQRRVYDILIRHAKVLKINSAVAILADPRSGAIRALVSLPSFDANLFESGFADDKLAELFGDPEKPLFNRAIAGEYPSGSTIKPIIAAAALEEEIITPDFLVYSGGSIAVPSIYNSEVIYEFKDWKAHGWTNLRKAIADSVNIYFYTIGGGYGDKEGLGIKKMEEYLRKFGWGEILGIDIPGERGGLIPSPRWKKEVKNENWYIGDTYITSIGQGNILVTPLQVAAMTAAFANGGTLFTPHFTARQDGDTIIRRNFIAQKNIEAVREGMRRAVTTGSSRFLAKLPYSVAGKTGTAETGHERNHAWFTGFALYENPEIVVTILLEEGDDSNYAVRAAYEILDDYFKIFYPQN